ncbi:hypothetical protein Tco_1443578, partial [Tanacetum coccineum]
VKLQQQGLQTIAQDRSGDVVYVELREVGAAVTQGSGSDAFDNESYVHLGPTSALNSKDQHLHLFGPQRSPSKKETIPSNIHVVQQPDAIVTTPTDTIRPSQPAISVCNDKQQLCVNQRKMDRCRVAQSQPNRELHPDKQHATASIRTNRASTYNHRFEKSSDHSTSRPHMARAQAIRPPHLDEQANNDIQ